MDTARERAWLLKDKYTGQETPAFFADCARLEAGEPLAYVIGYTPFLNCQIHLDSKPLIPRPETEFWVENAIRVIKKAGEASPRPLRVLDLCAGSGCVGVAVANAVPEAHVTFAELDPAHLPTIEKNIAANLSAPVNTKTANRIIYDTDRYTVVAADVYTDVGGVFDFILSNPPYIDPEAGTVDPEVVAAEPHLALFGGEAGMEVIARIIDGARAKLAPQGQLWLEHEPFHATAISARALQNSLTAVHHSDQYGTVRYSVLSAGVTE